MVAFGIVMALAFATWIGAVIFMVTLYIIDTRTWKKAQDQQDL